MADVPTLQLDRPEPPKLSPRVATHRIALAALLVGTAVAYLWNITINGMGNQFYAAAAWAGSTNWEALLFGSLDPQNFITVDKPPASQWVMGLSGQLFGFSSASMLIPQALMAVAAVALLYGAVARVSGPWAGILAGTALAVTPVAALMFRFNNPDAVMMLLMTAGAYCTVRALQRASGRWLALAGVALGFAFLAKMLEGLMVMPALALAYLIAAPTTLRNRLLHLLGALAALIVSSGWYVAVTLAWPASSRPYLAGSTDDNFMNLVLGYNGFARVLGRNHGGFQRPQTPQAQQQLQQQIQQFQQQMGSRGRGGFGGFGDQQHGLTRLFSGEFGFEVAWLLPAALLAFALVLWSRRRAPRTDLVRAGAIVFGGWVIVDGLVLSYMSGTIHPYYCLSLVPGIAGIFAIGVTELWAQRSTTFGRVGLAALLLVAAGWSFWILRGNSSWFPELRWAILAITLVAVAVVLVRTTVPRVALAGLVVALIAGLGGSTAYALATIGQPHEGGGPTVGPARSGDGGRRGGNPAFAGMFGGGPDSPQLDAILRQAGTRWSAAMARSSSAAGLELQSHTAIMAIGGFSGSDPAPTLAQFQQDVADHEIGYYLVPAQRNGAGGRTNGASAARGGQVGRGGQPGGMPAGMPFGGRNAHADIDQWVTAHYTPQTVGSMTVYDLRS